MEPFIGSGGVIVPPQDYFNAIQEICHRRGLILILDEVMTGCGAPAQGPGPWHLDLRARLAEQAARLGLGTVTVSGWCSAHDRDSFYSHRASRGTDGRMVAYLGMPR